MVCDACSHMGLGIPAFRMAISKGTESLYAPRVDLQCNLRAGSSSKWVAVGRDFLTDGDCATLAAEIVLSFQRNTCADSYTLIEVCRPFRCYRFTPRD